MIDPSDLGWMAAILDIKGSVITKRNTTRATPQYVIMVETKERRIVSKLCAMTGQTVELKRQNPLPADWARRACTEHCPEPHVHLLNETPLPMTSRWTLTGAAAAVILHSLQPHMTSWVDRGWGDVYHNIHEDLALTGRGSGAVRAALIRLMGLGWPLPDGWADELSAPLALEAG